MSKDEQLLANLRNIHGGLEWNECYLLADFPVLSAIFYNLPYGGKDNAVSDAIINPNGYVAIPLDKPPPLGIRPKVNI